MRIFLQLIIFLSTISAFAQTTSQTTENLVIGDFVKGSLLLPPTTSKPPLAILIQGSGPTDRDGNQENLRNNSLKKLAEYLATEGIASFRYDKRTGAESDLRFDDFVSDATTVLRHFSRSNEYKSITLIGHSQGSLVGMLAAKNAADAFVSIAGAGQPIDSLIITQVSQLFPTFKENIRDSFKELRKTGKTNHYNPLLASIFRPSVQPFLHSYLNYDPAQEIARLEIPVLIINGTRDLQISEEQAQLLFESSKFGELLLLKDMNHVLRKITVAEHNLQSYKEPERALHPELVPSIVKFIKELE